MEAEAGVRSRGMGEESDLQAGRCVFGGLPFFVGSGESANQRVSEGGLDDVCGDLLRLNDLPRGRAVGVGGRKNVRGRSQKAGTRCQDRRILSLVTGVRTTGFPFLCYNGYEEQGS
jgi:hypothetical protein